MMRAPGQDRRHAAGFTLIEMIIVIVISGILATMISSFIAQPMQGYVDLSRRATLVGNADNALRRMQRDVRRALPNSLRVGGGGTALELLQSVDGGRYRDDPPGDPGKRLAFNSADTEFNLLGTFTRLAIPFSSSDHRLVIYNVGVAGADAWQGVDVITPAGMTIGIAVDGANPDEHHVTLGGAGFQFRFPSPSQRLYLIDGPVSYVCEGGELRRYWGYGISAAQAVTGAALSGAGASSALVTDQVSACNFTYQAGTQTRAGLMTLVLTLSDGTGEQVRLLQQAHVDNTP